MPIDPEFRPIVLSGGAILALGVIYFALRWRVSHARQRHVVSTPSVDRRNREVLQAMGEGKQAPNEGQAPDALVKAVDEVEQRHSIPPSRND